MVKRPYNKPRCQLQLKVGLGFWGNESTFPQLNVYLTQKIPESWLPNYFTELDMHSSGLFSAVEIVLILPVIARTRRDPSRRAFIYMKL